MFWPFLKLNVFTVVFMLAQERDLGDEYGWKQVHGDVFSPASHSMLFSALVGAGYQVTVVVLSVIIFAMLGELYTE
jgi:transmembrane 9 superfamily protein 3